MSEIIHYLTNLATDTNSENMEISEELQLAIQNNDIEFLEKELGLESNICSFIVPAEDDDEDDDSNEDHDDDSNEENKLLVNAS